ncbi:MAG TPA: CsiV family protein, partial [Rheinheimera sp.]|nr:CsiV family protein [Rheinheimera sp.]
VPIAEINNRFNQAAEQEFTTELETSISNDNQLLSNIDILLQQLSVNSQLTVTDTEPLSESETGDVLAQRNLPAEVWQLDGLFKLHLDHYLFVNTEFNLRLPHEDKLQTIYVRQSRRVISGEMHYLDHPYLGILLQIRRYEPPVEDIEQTEAGSALLTD